MIVMEKRAVYRVHSSKEDARNLYDRISGVYDWLGGFLERQPAQKALDYLVIQSGEIVLEIGFGTGHCLKQIAILVGDGGSVYGIDISEGMLRRTRQKLSRASLLDRAKLYCGDAI